MNKKNKLVDSLLLLCLIGTCAFMGTQMGIRNLNNIRFADQYAGTDCGAKINAADTDLGSSAGEIWVNQLCALTSRELTITTPVALSAGHVLRFVQGGTYSMSAGITMGASSLLTGSTSAMATTSTLPTAAMLQMANGVNLSAMVTVHGPYAAIQDIAIDGNCLKGSCNNPSAGPNIVISSGATRTEIDRVTSGNSNSHGVAINFAAGVKMFKLMTYQNAGDGLYCKSAGDGFATDSEFEANQGNGAELNTCPGWRIAHSDFGQNSQVTPGTCGLNIYGPASNVGSGFAIITSNQFGTEFRDSLCITGYNNGFSNTIGNIIEANSFIADTPALANTYSKIKLIDGGTNTITGNLFISNGGNSALAAINSTESSSGRSFGNRIADNVFIDSLLNTSFPRWGTARTVDSTVNGIECHTAWMTLSSGWGGSGVAGNGVLSPHGYVPSCTFTLSTGGGSYSPSPTVTFTFPGSLLQSFTQTPACELTVVAITGSGGAIIFNPTTASATSTVWTAETSTGGTFKPAAAETYKVVLSCSP
jgi:hypothetical protein